VAPPIGTCRLCETKGVELRGSHLLPASLYRLVRGDAPNPVLVGATATLATSKQIWAHLLCGDCEQRFSSRGEDWIARNCWQGPDDFPVRSALLSAEPVGQADGDRLYDAATIPGAYVPQLAYFAVSVFWRGGAHRWRHLRQSYHIALGPYLRPLAEFLLDRAPFPSGVALMAVVNAEEGKLDQVTSPPATRSKGAMYRTHQFDIPGIRFFLVVGGGTPTENLRLCTVRTGQLAMSPSVDRWRAEEAVRLMRRSERKGR
jgi:hypothetical protein